MGRDIIKSVVAAVLVALIFFVWNNLAYKTTNISGVWKVQHIVLESSYLPYKGMKLFYVMVLQQSGASIQGTGEKIAEQLGQVQRFEYIRSKRVLLEINGNLKSSFLRRGVAILHIFEKGRSRYSSTSVKIEIINDKEMVGTFYSTAGDAIGKAIWEKESK